MKIDTRLQFGDIVWAIHRINEPQYKTCSACTGEGIVTLGGESMVCPKCYGSGRVHDGVRIKNVVSDPLTVGMIRVFRTRGDVDWTEEVMCEETGIGSGSVYNVRDLYKTEHEAQTDALQRNRMEATK